MMNPLEIVGLVAAAILGLLQPIALILIIPIRNTKVDFLATVDILAVYVVGIYSYFYTAITVGKLVNKGANQKESRIFFFVSAIAFGVVEIPVFIFNLIEIFSHSEMFHLHIDVMTALLLLVDIIMSLTSSITLGFSYDPDQAEGNKAIEMKKIQYQKV